MSAKGPPPVNRSIPKRWIRVGDHRTSVTLEDEFFDRLIRIANRRLIPLNALFAEIDQSRPEGGNLSSAARLYVLADTLALAKARGGEPATKSNANGS